MLLPLLAMVFGLIVLLVSSNAFIDGAASTAKHFGMPPLLIGMIIVGFGTSAPEMVVSTISALQGNPGIAVGNAYGSNIANIALILGITALISPVSVRSSILKKELPVLTLITLVSITLVFDLSFSLFDAGILLVLFASLMAWSVYQGLQSKRDELGDETDDEVNDSIPLKKALLLLLGGIVFLVGSSRLIVWGAVEVARYFGVSDLIIGLTIVAIGTSLPELASSIIAAKKGQHDIAIGNVIGSNLFNTTAVVGIAGAIHPFAIDKTVLYRDMTTMFVLTVSLFIIGYGFRGRKGRVNRFEGAGLVTVYILYTAYLLKTAVFL